MNGEFINFSEREPAAAADFVDIAHNLPEASRLLLRPSAVHDYTEGKVGEALTVSYHGLDVIPSPKPARLGSRIVTKEFLPGAEQSQVDREQLATPAETYPILKVVDYRTENEAWWPIDIAELVLLDSAEIHASGARRQGGGEYLRVDLSLLARQLAQEIGLDSDAMMVVTASGPMLFEEALPVAELIFPNKHSIAGEDVAMTIDPRSDVALDLLQLSIAETFDKSPLKVTSLDDSYVGIELLMKPIPEMQHCIDELIALVEAKGCSLMLEKGEINTGEWGFCLSVVSESTGLFPLSGEVSLPMAIYAAYEAAQERFHENR